MSNTLSMERRATRTSNTLTACWTLLRLTLKDELWKILYPDATIYVRLRVVTTIVNRLTFATVQFASGIFLPKLFTETVILSQTIVIHTHRITYVTSKTNLCQAHRR